MITILNRKELFITYSLQKQAEIQNLLSAHNIEYSISVLGNVMQSNTRGFGIRVETQTECKFYVKKKDYEEAVFILNQKHEE
ncbi:MAG: hypothetical protein EOM28_01760 [Clostridia bacterium]|nr:hypothetical protein [Clostridia bacterium]